MSRREHKKPERLPADLEMTWANYIVPVASSAALMLACWTVGHFQCSLLWICLFTSLYFLKTHAWIRREQKRMRLRNMIIRERETVMAQYAKMDDLPAWVQFPDIERIEWVNKIIHQLWPYIGEYTKVFLKEFIEPQVRVQMPSPFKSFKFVSVDVGDIPFRVGGLKVYTQNVGRDKVIVDMDVVYAGDAEFAVQACGFRGGLNQIVLSGKLRCTLQPLLPYPPMVGGVSGAFIELPKFDFNLTGMGEFVNLPGLIDAIRGVINSQVANLAVLPNKVVVPLAPNVDVSTLYFPEPDGIVRMKIVEAMNLENKDNNFLNRKDISDPYCEVQVGSQIFHTKVINNNLNPVFNECFEAVVDQASGQKLRIELFDKDTAGADEELGRLSIPLESVRKAGEIDKWHHLEGCKHGELRLKVCWLELSTEPADLRRDEWEQEWLGADKPMHPALLMVFVDSVSNLPYPKSNLEPSPFVEVSLGRTTQRTPVKPKTVNPLFQSKFNFFVKQPEGQELRIKAIDEGTRRDIGELCIPLGAVLREPLMELTQQSFYLQHGVHSSPIVLTVRLRFFTPPKTVIEGRELSSAYGTAAHIERGERTEPNGHVASVAFENGAKKSQIDAVASEQGKTVVQNGSETTPEMQLDAHNLSVRRSLSATGSAASSHSTKSNGLFGKLLSVGGTKHRMRTAQARNSIAPAGKVQIGLSYEQDTFKLVVCVLAARDLNPVEQQGRADPYVTLRLVATSSQTATKHNKSRHVRIRTGRCLIDLLMDRKHTTVVQNSLAPQFDQHFEFDIHFTDLPNYKLQLMVKDAIHYGLLAKQPTLGMAEIPLQNFDPMKPIASQWLELTR